MVHTITFRVASEQALDFWAARLAAEGIETRRGRTDGCASTIPKGLGLELAVVATAGRAARRAASRDPRRARAPGLRRRARVRAPIPRRAAGCSRARSASSPTGASSWEARGAVRGGLYAYDPPPASGPGIPGAGTVHHVAWASNMDEQDGLARDRPSRRTPPERDHRPLLVPLDLLPRAERRPVRDRHARPGLHDRRGPRAPRRGADPAAGVRAPARPDRAGADAAPRSAGVVAAGHVVELVTTLAPARAARGRRAGRARSCSCTAAAPTSTTSTRCSTRSTRSAACSGSLRAARSRCRPAAPTGTGSAGSRHPIRRRSSRPSSRRPRFLDALPVPLDRVVLGGFSQGAVMSWALGLGAGRPRPAAIIALSGLHAAGRGVRARPGRPRGLPGRGRARLARPRDPGRVRPRGGGGGPRRRRRRALARDARCPHTIDPRVLPRAAGVRPRRHLGTATASGPARPYNPPG